MLLSRQADYAVRLVLDLALHDPEQVQVRDVAQRHCIPPAYLQKVVQRLVRAGLVRTLRGPRGGVRLSRPPSHLSLREVVEAVEGPVVFNRCQLWGGECEGGEPCQTHAIWESLSALLSRSMQAITFDALASGRAVDQLESVTPSTSHKVRVSA